ncbi:MbcA/ParS/Xre antitoxin family protein [Pseudomonas sp.]|uniref:MbcA/ParS/Xre antitoxin family protein n=1 Tax=Pseudomonas sp. TaxID=306 RepID=UPI003BB75AAC
MSGHALAKCPVTIYRNSRSRWAEIRTLGNAKPIELCDTDEGAAKVRRVLSAIEHGNSV